VGGNDDLEINQQLAGLPLPIVVNRDRWQETEADSGSNFNDVIRGDALERIVGGFGFTGCDALDPAGVARITGLGDYVKTFPTSLADVNAVSAAGTCPLKGAPVTAANPVVGDPAQGGVWAEGNVLFGGGGSDVIEGRENQDIIDGDNAVNVGIDVHANADGSGAVLGSTDLMEDKVQAPGSFGPGTTGMTLQQAVFAGLVDPGQLVASRFIVQPDTKPIGATPNRALPGDCPAATADPTITDPAVTGGQVVGSTVKLNAAANCDTAVFSGEPTLGPDGYTITANSNGSVTVTDIASAAAIAAGTPFPKGDGIDTLWNVENLRFCIHNDPVTKLCDAFKDVSVAPALSVAPASLAFGNVGLGATSTPQVITVKNTGVASLTGLTASSNDPQFATTLGTGCASIAGGGTCSVSVRFSPASTGPKTGTVTIGFGAGTEKTVAVTGTGVAVAPAAPTLGAVTRGNASATVNWTPGSDGGSPITGFQVRVVLNGTNTQVGALRPATAGATSLGVTGLTNGTAYRFQVRATNAVGTGAFSALSAAVTPATVPTAPTRITASPGANRGPITAIAGWAAPGSTGGSPITGYQVKTLQMSSGAANATVVSTTTSAVLPATARSLELTLTLNQQYRFVVVAINGVGTGPDSARSGAVTPR